VGGTAAYTKPSAARGYGARRALVAERGLPGASVRPQRCEGPAGCPQEAHSRVRPPRAAPHRTRPPRPRPGPPVRVHKVDAVRRADAAQEPAAAPLLEGVPADVRDREPEGRVKVVDAAGDDAEALVAARLCGSFKQQLEAEADAEEGLAGLGVGGRRGGDADRASGSGGEGGSGARAVKPKADAGTSPGRWAPCCPRPGPGPPGCSQ
jgi:hypothetical protein